MAFFIGMLKNGLAVLIMYHTQNEEALKIIKFLFHSKTTYSFFCRTMGENPKNTMVNFLHSLPKVAIIAY